MRKVFIVYITVLIVILTNTITVKSLDNDLIAVYFYTSTCSTCQKLTSFFDDISSNHKNLVLKKYNITDLKNKSLMDKYNKEYKVSEEDKGVIPVVFIKNTYLTGEKAIKKNLENLIIKNDGLKTFEIKDTSPNYDTDIQQFMSLTTLSVFFAGLVNGINPCSISMLLFFLSLIMVQKVNIMKIGLAFCIGKFTAYMFLGTIFFGLLSKLNIEWFHITIKIVMLVVILTLILLNVQDFFAAKNEKYNKIRVQLPVLFRKLNHSLIKKISNVADLKFILLMSLGLGIIISLGEFLCTGQIYLTTIVTILQTNKTLNLKAVIYLFMYDFAFIIPLLILTFLIYKGKEVFEVSEVIREKLHLIKIINICLFVAFGIIVIYSF